MIIICPDHQHYPAFPAAGLNPITIPGGYPGTTFTSRLDAGLALTRPIPGNLAQVEAKHPGVKVRNQRKALSGPELQLWIEMTIEEAQQDPSTANRVICISSQGLGRKSTTRFTGQKPYGKIGRIALMMIPEAIRNQFAAVLPTLYTLEAAGIGTLFDYALMEELRKRNLFLVDQYTWLMSEHCGSRSNKPVDWINKKPSLVRAVEVLERTYPHSTSAVTMRNLLNGTAGCRKFGHKGWRKP